ncbi:MAG: hypothetical protein IPN13_14470 [Bacteroidetes bacterium]|nr:hypothetical protein [Bacteroidota bacterium]
MKMIMMSAFSSALLLFGISFLWNHGNTSLPGNTCSIKRR